jgi:hypothetical protein
VGAALADLPPHLPRLERLVSGCALAAAIAVEAIALKAEESKIELTDFEVDFLTTMIRVLRSGKCHCLSEKQTATLAAIYTATCCGAFLLQLEAAAAPKAPRKKTR